MARRAKGDGSLYYDAKQDLWRGEVVLDGKRRRVSARKKADAAAKLKRVVADGSAYDERQTLAQYLNWWTGTHLAQRVQGGHIINSTRLAYERVVRVHLMPPRREGGLGDLRLQAVTVRHVDDLLAAKLDAGYAPRTAQAILHVLRIALSVTVKKDMLARNVATLADPPSVRRPKVTPLTPEVASAVLTELRGDRLEALFTVALALGLRLGEALGLGWDAVDLDGGSVRLHRNLKRERGRWVFGDTKTHADVTLPLPASTVAALRAPAAPARRAARGPRVARTRGRPGLPAPGRPSDHRLLDQPPAQRRLRHSWRRPDHPAPVRPARRGDPATSAGRGAGGDPRPAAPRPDRHDGGHLRPRHRRAAQGHGRPDGGPPRRDTPHRRPHLAKNPQVRALI